MTPAERVAIREAIAKLESVLEADDPEQVPTRGRMIVACRHLWVTTSAGPFCERCGAER